MVLDTLIGRAIIGKELAKQQGISDPGEQLRLGLVGGLIDSSVIGLVATAAIARQQANQDGTSPDSPPTVEEVKVPDVVQYDSFEQARAALAAIELKAKETSVYSADDPDGAIVGQTPEAGDFVPKGTTVEVKIARKAMVPTAPGKMPLLLGLSLDEAKETLVRTGAVDKAKISVVDGFSQMKAAPNTVIMQNPDPDSAIGPETRPTLMVMGAVTVPDVKGMTALQAALSLTSQRLVPDLEATGSQNGRVEKQVPEAGTIVALFSLVKLCVTSQEAVVG